MTTERDALAEFTEYVVANYPPGTIISDPAWHAPRLFRRAERAIAAGAVLAAQPEQHIDGRWCADLSCGKCYSADFRFKHAPPAPIAAPAQGNPRPRSDDCVRVCMVKDIVCSTPDECDQRETGCKMLINVPDAVAQPAEPPAQGEP